MKNDNQPNGQAIKSRSEDICYSCEGVLWVSLFFDGFGYSLPEFGGASSVSNVGKLYRAHEKTTGKKDRVPFYYPGLGSRFEPELATIAKTAAGVLEEKGSDKAKSKLVPGNPVNSLQGNAQQYAKGKAELAVQANSMADLADVVKGTADDAASAGGRIFRHAKQAAGRGMQGNIEMASRLAERSVSGLVSYWRSFAVRLVTHPLLMLRDASVAAVRAETSDGLSVVIPAVVGTIHYGAEYIPPARDAAVVAALFNTGVDTRLEAATDDFKRAVAQAKELYTVKHINVAIFGYDNGGAIAIAFANRLINEVCKSSKYDGIEVKLRFVGLFDCVGNRYTDNFVSSYVGLSGAVVTDMKLPVQAEKIVHLGAAHEHRFFKPLTTIGGKSELGAQYEEWLYPGSQGDVGGGYEDGDGGKSNKLARVPLNFMHMQARRQAVPFVTLDSMKRQTRDFYETFVSDPAVEQLVKAYRKHAIDLAKRVVPFSPQELVRSAVVTYTGCVRAPLLSPPMMLLPGTLKEELKGHQALFMLWIRQVMASPNAKDDPTLGQLRREMVGVERAASMHEFSGDEKELYELWKASARTSMPADIQALFSDYVHDSLFECAFVVEQVNALIYGPHQLQYRSMLPITEKAEPNWLDQLNERQQKYAQTLNSIGPSGYPQATATSSAAARMPY